MSKVRITVVNDSAVQESFSIFNEFPKESTTVGQPWMNVWAVSPLVNSTGGSTNFTITQKYYAVCGMSPPKIAEGVTVDTQDQVEVVLASTSTPGTLVPMLAKDSGVYLDKKNIGQEITPRTYEIDTGLWDAAQYELAFLGLGRPNPAPNPTVSVTPVAVIPAQPSQKYILSPTETYYISTGKLTEGTVMKISQLGQIAKIDFSGKDENLATVHLQENLTYGPVKYSTGKFDDEE
ncbi:MAG: hypothetical protein Q9167_005314 [Letrouitia subvulpina]